MCVDVCVSEMLDVWMKIHVSIHSSSDCEEKSYCSLAENNNL